MDKIVEMIGIDKGFPGVQALKDAQLELRKGEVHALMGENGAGKSTLMKVLSGIYKKDAGEILIRGKSEEPVGPREAQALGIGIIHQELSLMNDLSAAQNIFIGREPRRSLGRIDDAAMNRQAAELFAAMHLDLDPAVLVGDLTIAKQQMIEIAKALSFDSEILVMDEPTAALNDAEIADLFVIINELKAKGHGIIYISHKMDELKRIADRVTIMRDGQYVGTVEAKETPVAKIIAMMVGREVNHEPLVVPDLSEFPVALEVRGLTRGKEIRDVSFDLRKGEVLGFAGLMGAGRTEVARAIFGADPLEAGEILVAGETTRITSPYDAVKAGIGYLSEDRKRYGLAVTMDVAANTVMPNLERFTSSTGVLNEPAIDVATSDMVDKLKIRTPSIHQEVRLLSGGNQQKIVVGKWLLRDCDIFIFDEPTRGIDVGAKAEIYKLIEDLTARGKAVIMISSELPEVMRLSHRILVMCEGRVTGILPGGEETSQEDIMTLATQRETTQQNAGNMQ
ncbi:sugar ABC transporter ATP-binding protein [Tropicimonas sp. TH_r6]|uniref:sugar ABC transporter ATP-binding protein n=1 Tax=Tropicimonas sp. TH_r6 TaxID=3082085 RepID=UPI0029546F3D|nr:sugar ABC transporter ATP-binding protein [Tropicimonas sp. TH_r6]MDV7145567.1 sugar ABC transporter ATP-binding protein [Tropicimonas sp. TH_r6]